MEKHLLTDVTVIFLPWQSYETKKCGWCNLQGGRQVWKQVLGEDRRHTTWYSQLTLHTHWRKN